MRTISTRSIRLVVASALASAALVAATPAPSGSIVDPSFDFEDGLQGWTVEAGPASPDTWSHVVPDNGSTGAVAVEGYGDNADTTITSPELSMDGTSVLQFRSTHWTENVGSDDVAIQASTDDGATWTELDRVGGRGRWPVWDLSRYELPDAPSVRVRFTFTSDAGCSSVDKTAAVQRLNARFCGRGYWFDDVELLPTSAAATEAAWGTAPDAVAWPARPTIGDDLLDPASHTARAGQLTGWSPGTDDESRDQVTNPAFLEAWQSLGPVRHVDAWTRDPLADPTFRGRVEASQHWFDNRYDTPIGVRAYHPVRSTEESRAPLLVFIGGWRAGGGWLGYEQMFTRLAADGYVVLAVNPQGQGMDERASAAAPAPSFCGPLDDPRDAPWRRPQEAGLTEQRHCAGTYADEHYWTVTASSAESVYRDAWGTPVVFTTLDAIDWALSVRNPLRASIDSTRVGVFGHSLGGYGALAAVDVHPRVDAAVLIDSYGTRDGLDVTPAAPLLAITLDNRGTFADLHVNPLGVADGTAASGVDGGFLYLRDVGHDEVAWRPVNDNEAAELRSPWAKPIVHHYLLAWFDHHLRDDPTGSERLTATVFDGSADATATGTGRWTPQGGNEPYRIEGRSVAAHLNDALPSWIQLDGVRTELG